MEAWVLRSVTHTKQSPKHAQTAENLGGTKSTTKEHTKRPQETQKKSTNRTRLHCSTGYRLPSTPRRGPRFFRTDSAPCRRLRLRNNVIEAFGSRGTRPARALPRGEPADRPRSTLYARWRTWRGCLHGQRGARCTSRHWTRLFHTDTAPCRRLRLRKA